MRRARGFTLIEVLIGTTVLGIMLSLMMGALFTLAKSAHSGEARLDALDGLHLTRAFLRRELRETAPLTLRKDDKERVVFDGERDHLYSVGQLPAHAGSGGLRTLRFELDGNGAFTLAHRLVWAERSPSFAGNTDIAALGGSNEGGWRRELLVEDVAHIAFGYFGALNDESPPRWHDIWRDADRLPSLIRLEVELADGTRWLPLTVAVDARTALGRPELYVNAAEATL